MKPTHWFVILLLPAMAYGQTTVFTGASDYQTWSDPANWDNGVPLDGYDVVMLAIDEPYSSMDLPNLTLNSLHVTFGRDGGDLSMQFPLAITEDLIVIPGPTAEAVDCFSISNIALEVGGNVLLINCRWHEGSANIGGDFYFQGSNASSFFGLGTGSATTRVAWQIGGDFWVPTCAGFDVTRADFTVNGDFVLNGSPLYQAQYSEMTLNVAGNEPSLISLPIPQHEFSGPIPSVTVNKSSSTDLVVLDTAELGYVRIQNLVINGGIVDLRTDARIDEVTIGSGATLISNSSIGLRGNFLIANGQLRLEAPGISLAMVGIGTGSGGTISIAGSVGQPAWLTNFDLFREEMYLSCNPGSISIRDAAIGRCRALPEISVTRCRDLGLNSGIIFGQGSAVEGDPIPQPTALGQNFPNPFNLSTKIHYELQLPGPATLRIFDIKGRLVRTLLDQEPIAAQGFVTWDGLDDRGMAVATGAYLYQLSTEAITATRKMVLLK